MFKFYVFGGRRAFCGTLDCNELVGVVYAWSQKKAHQKAAKMADIYHFDGLQLRRA